MSSHVEFNQAFNAENNKKLSLDYEPNIEYEETVSYLVVSSKDRDVSQHPNVNHYMIDFPREFKNIKSIELIQAILPDQNDIKLEPYILLKIEELEDVMVSNDRNVSDAFAIIQISCPAIDGGFINMDTKIHEKTVKYFKTPKASLSRMTVRVTDYAGALFDFGSATPGFSKEYQNTFVFKVITLDRKRVSLAHRSVF
jgi:hypothetical protein